MKYYAEIRLLGNYRTTKFRFDTKKERDEFIKQDYTNKISSKVAKREGFMDYKSYKELEQTI